MNVCSIKREGHGFHGYGFGVVASCKRGEIGQNDGTGIHFRFRAQTRWEEGNGMRCFGFEEEPYAFEFRFELH